MSSVTNRATTAPAPSGDSGGLNARQWLVLSILSLSLAIIIIDASIVNVTIPAISKEFNASIPNLQWISSAYALVYAALGKPPYHLFLHLHQMAQYQ